MSRMSWIAAIATAWFAQATPASVSITVDVLDESDGGPQPPGSILIVDVMVDVSPNDVWVAGGVFMTTVNGAIVRYAHDANGQPAVLNPGADDPFVTCFSRPRPRNGSERFTNARAILQPRAPFGANVFTPDEVDVIWASSPPPTFSSPSVDGAIARIAIEANQPWCPCCPAVVFRLSDAPPDALWLAVFGGPEDVLGVISSTRAHPSIVGDDWVLVLDADATPTCAWSVDSDLDVDLDDLALLLTSFGLCANEPGFLLRADKNRDGCVDLADLVVLLAHFNLPCC